MAKRQPKTSDFIIAIIINVILLYVFNNLLNWHFKYVTPAFIAPLWILNISIGFTLFVNLIYLFSHPAVLRALFNAVQNVLGAVFMYTLYTVFPFDFSSVHFNLALYFRWVLIIGAIVIAAVAVGEFVHFLVLLFRPAEDSAE